MSSQSFHTEHAGTCDSCGHPVAGMIVRISDDDVVVCDECATKNTPGVHVKPRFDPDEERWYPGGYQKRMKP